VDKPCMAEDLMCMASLYENETDGFHSTCKRSCPKECDEVSYSYMASFANYPSISRAQKFQRNSPLFATYQIEEIRHNVLKLNIYFDKMSYQVVSESPALNFGNLIGNYGGYLSLFLGISALGFFEILNILHNVLFYKCKRSKKVFFNHHNRR
jgi:hypothetical protein